MEESEEEWEEEEDEGFNRKERLKSSQTRRMKIAV